jgi:hypothetical protein
MAFGNRLIDTGGGGGGILSGSLENATQIAVTTLPSPFNSFGIHISDDGTKFMVYSGYALLEYTLTTAYDITTAVYVNQVSASGAGSGWNLLYSNMMFDPTGTSVQYAVVYYNENYIIRRTLSSAYDLSTISGEVLYGALPKTDIYSFAVGFSRDGTTVSTYAEGWSGYNKRLRIHNLNTPYNITAGYTQTHYISNFSQDSFTTNSNRATQMQFNSDGTKMYIQQRNGVLYQFDLASAYNPVGATYSGFSAGTPNIINECCVTFSADYRYLYIGGYSSAGVIAQIQLF